jgi:hypothetical protein
MTIAFHKLTLECHIHRHEHSIVGFYSNDTFTAVMDDGRFELESLSWSELNHILRFNFKSALFKDSHMSSSVSKVSMHILS